jgi:hypothetical protein
MFYWSDLLFFGEKACRNDGRSFHARIYLACDILGYETVWSGTRLYEVIKLYSTKFQYTLILFTLKILTPATILIRRNPQIFFNKSNDYFSKN